MTENANHANDGRKQRRWPRRMMILLGLVVLSVVVFALFERFRGELALSRRIAHLKSSGEELSVSFFLPKPVEPGGNAFTILAALEHRTESILTNASFFPPSMNFAGAGQALVTWKLAEWDDGERATKDWNWLDSQLNDARELMAQLHAAAAQPGYDCGFDYNKGFLDFQIGPLHKVKQTAQILSAATMNDLRGGDPSAAHSNLCALVKLTVMQEPEPLVICQLVRQACAAIAFNTTWQVLQSRDVTEAQLAELQAIWSRARFADDMGRALEMERAMALDYGDRLRGSPDDLEFALKQQENVVDILGDMFGSLPARGFVLHRVYAPFWRFAWSAQDQLRSLNRWQFVVERERAARSNSWAALASTEGPELEIYEAVFGRSDEEKPGIYDRLRFLNSNQTFSVSDVVIRRELEAQTLQRLAITAIAIERYRRDSGTIPADLSAMVPRYLPAILQDPMDAKPLRYTMESENAFRLYSVGTDGKDDGGEASPVRSGKPYRQIWDGRDTVWPGAVEH